MLGASDLTVWWSLTQDDAQAPGRGDLAGRLLRRAVAELTGDTPSAVTLGRLCPRCGSSAHGRPVVVRPRGTGLHVSLARAPGAVAVAATAAGPVGVDVEQVARTAFSGFADVALHPDEVAGTPAERGLVWARKEAVLKAAGTGLAVDPREVRVSAPADPPALLDAPAGLVPDRVWLHDLDVPTGFAAAVAVVCAEPPRVTTHRKDPSGRQ